jgi:hypothetical protein
MPYQPKQPSKLSSSVFLNLATSSEDKSDFNLFFINLTSFILDLNCV